MLAGAAARWPRACSCHRTGVGSAQANVVVSSGVVTYTRRDGVRKSYPFSGTYKLRDGKIKDYQSYIDSHDLFD